MNESNKLEQQAIEKMKDLAKSKPPFPLDSICIHTQIYTLASDSPFDNTSI